MNPHNPIQKAGTPMVHARKRCSTALSRLRGQWALHAAVLVASSAGIMCGINAAAGVTPRELPILPTVHPTLTPTRAIPVPLYIGGDRTSVWKSDLEQRMLVHGHVRIDIGYRSLHADNAALWLTPSREAGEATWDVAIYLSGNVHVLEGGRTDATATQGNELMVTTRLSRNIQLQNTPVSRAEETNPIFQRGEALRQEILNRPPQPIHIPQITITSTEEALQAGWIARGPDNRIVAGPGDFQLTTTVDGRKVAVPPNAPRPAKPRPLLFIAGDPNIHAQQMGNEMVSVITNPYLLYDALDGKPAIEFHSQRMVTFSPMQHDAANKTDAGSTEIPGAKNAAKYITGVYMEGDVTLNAGDMTIHAKRIYYDFTSQRAVMLDSTLYSVDTTRNVPVYLRAKEIRQLARGEYAAKDASFSTSEFHTPHYNIGASNVYLQDITPHVEGETGHPYDPSTHTKEEHIYAFKAQNTTVDVQGVPIFYWPYLAGDTSNDDIPLRRIRVSNSREYGLSLQTNWNLFALAGQPDPKNFHADLSLDYFGKRGPAGGVDANWNGDDYKGLFRSYGLEDRGVDRLGASRTNVDVLSDERGRVFGEHHLDLGDGWTMNLEGSYISDPNFLQEFFNSEFNGEKEHETSFYLKHQDDSSALSFLGKFNLLDFTTVSDQVDDQFTTEKKPEAKYWRIGDSFLDLFTYYSESGAANVHSDITNYTPQQLSLYPTLLGPPASVLANQSNLTFRQAYEKRGWTTNDVLRGDTRQEIDMPLALGDLKVTPYATGRVTAWDNAFPDTQSGDTTRIWGSTGIRSSVEFWRVYSDVDSTFWDVHQLRHIIEPQFNVFATGTDQDRNDLQPFDRDVEGISRASGFSLDLNQKWQTKRGGPGHWRNVDWVTLNIQWNQFYDRDRADNLADNNVPLFFPQSPLRGFYFASRPELSLVQNSIAVDGTWRIGERTRFIGELNHNTQDQRLEQAAAGVAVDQTDTLSYFFGNRYVRALGTDEWTIGADYRISRKYEIVASEDYDFALNKNILSSFTLMRKLPRFNTAITVVYDADNADTTVEFTAWPEGVPGFGIGNNLTGK
jgi:hypothetical protein